MKLEKISFYNYNGGSDMIFACKPDIDASIVFRTWEGKWNDSPCDCWHIIHDTNNVPITPEQAKEIYGDIEPDETLFASIEDFHKNIRIEKKYPPESVLKTAVDVAAKKQ